VVINTHHDSGDDLGLEGTMINRPPKVFISYSYDTPEHEEWVKQLAAVLRASGIEAILDKWHFALGKPSAMDMNNAVAISDRVLCICTDRYIKRVDEGKGGAGYEGCLITAELVQDASTEKFIPVIRNAGSARKAPKCLDGRNRIDLSDGDRYGQELEQLLRHLLGAVEVPPLGVSPFSSGSSKTVSSGPFTPLLAAALTPYDLYTEACRIVRIGDLISWYDLEKAIRGKVPQLLRDWRKKHEKISHATKDDWFGAADEAVNDMAPAFVLALVGVKSRDARISDHSAFLSDLWEVNAWSHAGLNTIVEIPHTCAYVFQCLHGAMCLSIGDIETAVKLVDQKLANRDGLVVGPVWQQRRLMGWPTTLGNDSRLAWRYIEEAPQRWDWLEPVFGSGEEFVTCLVAYYMALNIHELAAAIALAKNRKSLNRLFIPIQFALTSPPVRRKSLQRLVSTQGVGNTMARTGSRS
jgi:hypothetical protein